MGALTVTHNVRAIPIRSVLRVIVGTIVGVTIVACSSEKADFTPSLDAHHFYERLVFEDHAINIATAAPYDTVQLHVHADMQDGTPVPGTIFYSTTDTAIEISATGLLTAKHPVTGAVVRASLTYNGFTRTDSALVNVLDGSPSSKLKTLTLAPFPGDSAKVTSQTSSLSQGTKQLVLTLQDSTDNDMSGLSVALRSSDTLTATIEQSGSDIVVTTHRPGRVMLYASTYAYGMAKTDSLQFIVGWPLGALLSVYPRTLTGTKSAILDFFPGTITLGVGACAVWANLDTANAVDITFDNPSAVGEPTGICALLSSAHMGSGNIPAFHGGDPNNPFAGFAGRSFPQAGEYPYQSTINGTHGTVIVCDELHDSSCFPY
jgi:hypothetical protein